MPHNGGLTVTGQREADIDRFPIYALSSGIQGEATWTGRAMLFVRFSGCPLSCAWCDEPLHKDAHAVRLLTAEEILATLRQIAPHLSSVLLTGGEPLAVKGLARLVRFLKDRGYWLAMETSGVGGAIPPEVDWVTLSPKTPLPDAVFARANELKYVVAASPSTQQTLEIQQKSRTHANVWVQPQDEETAGKKRPGSDIHPETSTGPVRLEKIHNTGALARCLEHIERSDGAIRLSLQTHKLVGLP